MRLLRLGLTAGVSLVLVTGCAASARWKARSPLPSVAANVAANLRRSVQVVVPAVRLDMVAGPGAPVPPGAPSAGDEQAVVEPDSQPSPYVSPAPEPAPSPIVAPDVTIVRNDMSKPTMFVLRGLTYGNQDICEAFPTKDACISTCTSKLRVAAMDPAARNDPRVTKQCSCLEQDGGC